MPNKYPISMATSTAYDDQQSISTDGFICSDDTVLGLRVSTMRQDNVPLGSVGGFMFFKQNVLDNSVCENYSF